MKSLIFTSLLCGSMLTSGAYAQGGGGQLVIVANNEPQSMQAQQTYKEVNAAGLRNIIEQLTRIDPETNEVLPMLATSWEQVSPTDWEFKLREGVTFHDGSPLNAENAAISVNWIYSEDNQFGIREMMGPQITAKAKDAMTLTVTTAAPDPLLARRIYLAGISSAKQITEDPGSHDIKPVGTGPYVFGEWEQGQFWTATANPDWWGNTAEDTYGEVYFDDLRFVWRQEPIIRAAMVESGEAQLAMFLTKEECERLDITPGMQCIVGGSDTFLMVRLDYHGGHPTMENPDFRKAFYTGIDWEGIRINLMGLGDPLKGQMLPEGSMGFNETLEQYPYDPEGARALIDGLKSQGIEVPTMHISTRNGSTPRQGEIVEAMGAMLASVGIENTIAVEEPGVFNPRAVTKADDGKRAYAWLHPQGNPLLDYAATFGAHAACNSRSSVFCDPDFDERAAAAGALQGDERHAALRELVAELHNRHVMGAVGLLQRAYGAPDNFEWTFGPDHRILAVNMRMAE